MREIKFRVWDKEKQIMLHAFPFDITFELQNEPYVAMQYTGLKDKNGKEIFENDILEHPEYGNCKVIYRYGGFGIEAKTSSWINTGFHSFSTWSADYKHCEVLGNLYENPNLLSQDK